MWTAIGLLTAVAVGWSLKMAPKANPFVLPTEIPSDMFFAFWMPLTRHLGGGTALSAMTAAAAALLLVPVATARRGAARPAPSIVDEDSCV
jgi:hypothetical protein